MPGIDDKGRKFGSTPIYDMYHTLVEEGVNLTIKEAQKPPFILTEIPTDSGDRNLWLDEKIFRAKKCHNTIASIHGPTAFYKSVFSVGQSMENQWIYWKLKMTKQKAWSLKNLMYQSLDIQQRVTELNKGLKLNQPICTSLVIDEQPAEYYGRDRSYFVWTSDFEKQVRKLLVNMYFCSPILEPHVAHYIVEMYEWAEEERLIKALISTGTGYLIGSIIVNMPTNEVFDMYNKFKDQHLIDFTSLKNKSIEVERKVAKDLTSTKVLMMGDTDGFPDMDYWSTGPATQVQYIMERFKIKVIQQAKDIRNLAADFYTGLYGCPPKRSRKGVSKEIVDKCKVEDEDTYEDEP
jgi:hypothetical protein